MPCCSISGCPTWTGRSSCRRCAPQPIHGETPVVLTTAESDDSELLGRARAFGVAAVVKKPWSPQALRGIVQKIIESPAE